MKTILLLFLWLPTPCFAQAPFDTAYVLFHGDTTDIWQVREWGCMSRYVSETSLAGDTLKIILTDTSSLHPTCSCVYTMRTSVIGLPTGTYHCVMYKRWMKQYSYPLDSTWSYDSLDFSVLHNSTSAFASNFRQSDCNGSLGAVEVQFSQIVPNTLRMSIFPNPSNPDASIEYWVPRTSHVALSIYNVVGQRIVSLVDADQTPGIYRVRFSVGDHASGAYISRLQVGNQATSTRFTVIR